jgi:hypothetical protein
MVRMELKGSFDAVQGEVEDVVVAQHAYFRSLPVLALKGAGDKEGHALLTETTMRAQGVIAESRQVMVLASGAERGAAVREHGEVALAIRRQLVSFAHGCPI